MRQVLIFLLATIVFYSCNVRAEEAAAYNDQIIAHQTDVIEAFDAMDTTLNNYIPEEMDYALLQLEYSVASAQRGLDEVGPFKRDSGLYKASKDLFNFYENICQVEYHEIVDILRVPDSLYTLDHRARAVVLEEAIRDGFNESETAFLARQKEWAQQYNVEIVDLDEE